MRPSNPLCCTLLAFLAGAAGSGPAIIPLSPETVIERIGQPPTEPLRGDIRLQIDAPVFSEAMSPESRTVVYIFTLEMTPPDTFEVNVVAPTPEGDSHVVADGEEVEVSRPIPSPMHEAFPTLAVADFSLDDLAMAGSGPSILLPLTMGMPSPTLEAITEPGTFEGRMLEPQELQGAMCDVVELTQRSGGAVSVATLSVERASGLLRRIEIEMPTGIPDMPCRLIEEFIFLERGPSVVSIDSSPEITQ